MNSVFAANLSDVQYQFLELKIKTGKNRQDREHLTKNIHSVKWIYKELSQKINDNFRNKSTT